MTSRYNDLAMAMASAVGTTMSLFGSKPNKDKKVKQDKARAKAKRAKQSRRKNRN